jgi:hypothetical protein
MAPQAEESPSSIAAKATQVRRGVKDALAEERRAKGSEERAANVLRVKYGGMLHSEDRNFSSSVAFWQGESSLVIVFRNFGAPVDDASVKPPFGRARLVAIIRTDVGNITPGTYRLGWLDSHNTSHVFVRAMEDKGKEGKEGHVYLFLVSAAWEVNTNGKTELEFWKDYHTLPPDQFREMLKNLGTVTLTEVGHQPGTDVVGTISLGSEEHLNMAVGAFRVPVLAPPQDF